MGQKVHPNGIRLGIVKTMELYLVCETPKNSLTTWTAILKTSVPD